ncbi:MAG: glycosyltransferase family 4 protein [Patescibacteria group bacterium]
MPRKKVVFIINNFLVGGVEKLLLDIISRLDKQKFAVSIITVFGAGPMEASFRELGLPVYFAGGRAPFYIQKFLYKIWWLLITPGIIFRLVWWLWRFRPDVVVTSLYHADVIGMLSSWLAGVPRRVLIHHDVYQVGQLRAWLKRELGVGLATTIVAVSNTVKEFVVDYFGATNSRVEIISNGINTESFRGANREADCSIAVLGMVGRLEPVKGPTVFAEALQILQTKFKKTPSSFLGGSGSLKDELISYASSCSLNNLKFDGVIRDVSAWMQKIDILIVPSISEGFGLVVLEGLASGKIVIASDLPATRGLITNEVNGFLFQVGDAEALAGIIYHLITNQVVFNKIQQGVRQWRQEQLPHYDIDQVAKRYEELLSE